MRYASEPVLKDLLPALDSLDLAIQYGGSDETCKSLLTGVIMTRKLLLDALKEPRLRRCRGSGRALQPRCP